MCGCVPHVRDADVRMCGCGCADVRMCPARAGCGCADVLCGCADGEKAQAPGLRCRLYWNATPHYHEAE
jgi:hypothetical protein